MTHFHLSRTLELNYCLDTILDIHIHISLANGFTHYSQWVVHHTSTPYRCTIQVQHTSTPYKYTIQPLTPKLCIWNHGQEQEKTKLTTTPAHLYSSMEGLFQYIVYGHSDFYNRLLEHKEAYSPLRFVLILKLDICKVTLMMIWLIAYRFSTQLRASHSQQNYTCK